MPKFRRKTILSCALLVALAMSQAMAQTADPAAPAAPRSGEPERPASFAERLFLSFAEDATTVDNQWWEGSLLYSDGDRVEVTLLRGTVAFQLWKDVEVGARVGFGSSDTPGGTADGTGATDLDLWGKMYFAPGKSLTEYALGGVLTVPTGDDGAGLGHDAFGASLFGAVRRQLERVVLSAHAGVRFTDDGRILGVDLEGETSPLAGVAVLVPLSDRVRFVGEFDFEGERFRDFETEARLLGGVSWRFSNRGRFRGALALGLSDGAPDFEMIAGYAWSF